MKNENDKEPKTPSMEDEWWKPISPTGERKQRYSDESYRALLEKKKNDPDNFDI